MPIIRCVECGTDRPLLIGESDDYEVLRDEDGQPSWYCLVCKKLVKMPLGYGGVFTWSDDQPTED